LGGGNALVRKGVPCGCRVEEKKKRREEEKRSTKRKKKAPKVSRGRLEEDQKRNFTAPKSRNLSKPKLVWKKGTCKKNKDKGGGGGGGDWLGYLRGNLGIHGKKTQEQRRKRKVWPRGWEGGAKTPKVPRESQEQKFSDWMMRSGVPWRTKRGGGEGVFVSPQKGERSVKKSCEPKWGG